MVGFAKAPTVLALKDIEGVIKVEKAEDRMYRIHFKNKQSPADAIVRLSVKNRWGLYQIAPDQTSLEDVFVQLTEKKQTN
jgi:ABC-2 type transport system ATP-binding protein